MPGAIVIAGRDSQGAGSQQRTSVSCLPIERRQRFLAGVELLGESLFARLVQQLGTAFDRTSVFVDSSLALDIDDVCEIDAYATGEIWRGAERSLVEAKEAGVDSVLLVEAGAYVDFDPADLIRFHRDCGNYITRARDKRGPLDIWVVDPNIVEENRSLPNTLHNAGEPHYWVPGYVNRMETLQDLRRLVADGLSSRSGFRPRGFEVRPGVWMGEGAEVERGARIVAPAFLGRDVKISEQCLITRSSNIESNCHIDYGTAVEGSSILTGSYVGIGLDLCHSIADGACLLNLSREVMLEIADPVVMRPMPQKLRVEGNRRFPSDFGQGEETFPPAGNR